MSRFCTPFEYVSCLLSLASCNLVLLKCVWLILAWTSQLQSCLVELHPSSLLWSRPAQLFVCFTVLFSLLQTSFSLEKSASPRATTHLNSIVRLLITRPRPSQCIHRVTSREETCKLSECQHYLHARCTRVIVSGESRSLRCVFPFYHRLYILYLGRICATNSVCSCSQSTRRYI